MTNSSARERMTLDDVVPVVQSSSVGRSSSRNNNNANTNNNNTYGNNTNNNSNLGSTHGSSGSQNRRPRRRRRKNPVKEITSTILCTIVNLIAYGSWLPCITITLITYLFSYEIPYSRFVHNFGYVFINFCLSLHMIRKLYLIYCKRNPSAIAEEVVVNNITSIATTTNDNNTNNNNLSNIESEEQKETKENEQKMISLTHPVINYFCKILYGIWLFVFVLSAIMCSVPAIMFVLDCLNPDETKPIRYFGPLGYTTSNLPAYSAQLSSIMVQIVAIFICTCWFHTYFNKKVVTEYAYRTDGKIEEWMIMFPDHPLSNTASWGYDKYNDGDTVRSDFISNESDDDDDVSIRNV